MKKPVLLFSLKCAVILYFAACTNIDRITVSKTVAQSVVSGSWKVDQYVAGNDHSNSLSGYDFSFSDGGKLTVNKNGNSINGNWYEDNVTKTLVLNIESNDKALQQLNAHWNITNVSDEKLVFETNGNESLQISKQ